MRNLYLALGRYLTLKVHLSLGGGASYSWGAYYTILLEVHLTLTEQGRLARCPGPGLEAQLAAQPGAWHAPAGDCNKPPPAYDRDYHRSGLMAS